MTAARAQNHTQLVIRAAGEQSCARANLMTAFLVSARSAPSRHPAGARRIEHLITTNEPVDALPSAGVHQLASWFPFHQNAASATPSLT